MTASKLTALSPEAFAAICAVDGLKVPPMKQSFAYTEPTPKEGYARYLQVFQTEKPGKKIVMRDRDGRLTTIDLTPTQVAELIAGLH